MAASSPAPGVGPRVPGMVVVVVPTGAEPGRHTSWYLSSSAPFVVEAWAWMLSFPLRNSPFSLGPTIGTTISTGAEHAVALDGKPSAATAASSPPVAFLGLKRIFLIWAGLHFGSAGSLWFRQTIGLNRQDPLRMPSASQGSPSAQVVPLKTFFPAGKPMPLAMS